MYHEAAAADGIDPRHPPNEWFTKLVLRRTQCSLKSARRFVETLSVDFGAERLPDATATPAIADLLRDGSDLATDPVRLNARVERLRSEGDEVAAFGSKAYQPTTRVSHAKHATSWEIYARYHHIDPLHPTPKQVATHLAYLAKCVAATQCRNRLKALHVYWRMAGVPDVTKHRTVIEISKSIERDYARRRPPPLFAEDLLPLMRVLGPSIIDRRTGLILLLVYYGALHLSELAELLVSDLWPEADGVVVRTRGREVFVGGVDEPLLDVRHWYGRWRAVLELYEVTDGAFFPDLRTTEGRLSGRALSDRTIDSEFQSVIRRAGLDVRRIAGMLRRGFVQRVAPAVGAALTAHHLGLKKANSLETNSLDVVRTRRRIRAQARRHESPSRLHT